MKIKRLDAGFGNSTNNFMVDGYYFELSTSPVYSSANIDGNSFKINRASNKSKNVCQTISISGAVGDTFVVSGWTKAVNKVTTCYHLVEDKVTYETNGTDIILMIAQGNLLVWT